MNTYRKNGFTWQIVDSTDYKAIASIVNSASHWEVFYWQHNPERSIAGVTVPASITPPGNEQWGANGWTFMNGELAMAKYLSLAKKEPAQ